MTSGSIVASFNDMLLQFLEELTLTFPEETYLAGYADTLKAVICGNPRTPMEMYVATIGPHSDKVMAKDPTFFQDCPVLFGQVNIAKLWGKDLSTETRTAIWQYLSTLLTLGTTVSMIPAEMLSGIEAVASQCAAEIQAGRMNMTDLAAMVLNPGVLSADGSSGTNPLMQLLQGAGAPSNSLAVADRPAGK